MPGGARSQFTYAILRIVPRIERGESFNAGVVLYCGERDFLAARTFLDERRLSALAADVAPAAVRAHLDTLVRIAEGAPDAGPVAALPAGEAVRLARLALEHDRAGVPSAFRAVRRAVGDARRALHPARRMSRQLFRSSIIESA